MPQIRTAIPLSLALLFVSGCAGERQEQPTQHPADHKEAVQTSPLADVQQHSAAPIIQERTRSYRPLTPSLAAPTGLESTWAPASPVDREQYQSLTENGLALTAEQPVSTFSVDVDTQAYANIRRLLNQGQLPRLDAVRIEEMINYFDYEYPAPADLGTPFSVTTEVAPSPWSDNHILRIGLQGYEKTAAELPPANLVFLIDVSGSMEAPNKLPLVQQSLRLLVNRLTARDRISLVVYAGAEGLVLEPTPGDQKATILNKIDQLRAGGSTNGGAGIQLAYQLAQQSFIQGGINRVILASDGDFNVGTVNLEALKDLVAAKRRTGISLTSLAFGVGNTNFELMEQLAAEGNGNAGYIDSLREANKLLVQEMGSTLLTIAKDVKVQVEFNPQLVREYRLIGYENRLLRREDFRNDQVDAGDIGAGHRVTALYEIRLAEQPTGLLEPLRYTEARPTQATAQAPQRAAELAFVKLRYKQPDGEQSQEVSQPVAASQVLKSLDEASASFRFACAVAGFGQLLRGGTHIQNGFHYQDVLTLAETSQSRDPFGYRGEFRQLVSLASSLTPHGD